MGWTDSKRAKKPPPYSRRAERWPRPSRTKTMLGPAIAVMRRSSPASASNGSCVIRKLMRRSPWCAIISSVSFPRIGKKFTLNGWRIFAIGASAVRCGGDIEYRPGIANGNQKSEVRSQRFTSASSRLVIRRIGFRMRTRSIHGFHRGCGLIKLWMTRRAEDFIRPACW